MKELHINTLLLFLGYSEQHFTGAKREAIRMARGFVQMYFREDTEFLYKWFGTCPEYLIQLLYRRRREFTIQKELYNLYLDAIYRLREDWEERLRAWRRERRESERSKENT